MAASPVRTSIQSVLRPVPGHGRSRWAQPTHVAGYEIEVELGRGGMGVVYKARHVRLNRPCALKMILAALHAGPELWPGL